MYSESLCHREFLGSGKRFGKAAASITGQTCCFAGAGNILAMSVAFQTTYTQLRMNGLA